MTLTTQNHSISKYQTPKARIACKVQVFGEVNRSEGFKGAQTNPNRRHLAFCHNPSAKAQKTAYTYSLILTNFVDFSQNRRLFSASTVKSALFGN